MDSQIPPPTERSADRKLRVMFLVTSMPVGGAETLLVNLVRRMDPDRFEPQICCLKERGPLGEEIAAEFPVHQNLIGNKYDVRVLGRLKDLFRQENVDAIVTVGAGDKMFWGRLAARQAKVPVILSALHSTGWPDGVGRVNRWLTGITDGFIAVADSHGEFLIDVEKFPRKKVHVITNGIDVGRFQFDPEKRAQWRSRLGIPVEAPVCGMIAALRPEKNHMLFLHCAGKVLKQLPQAHFLIAGDGPQRALLETSVTDLGLSQRVHLVGSIRDIEGCLSAMDLFALTSHNEASPVSILEAMACRLPVVATDVGSVSESVLDGQTGFVVPAGDAEKMSRRWLELLTEPSKREQFGNAARRHVTSTRSLEIMVAGYEKLIRRIFESKQGSRGEADWSAIPVMTTEQEVETGSC